MADGIAVTPGAGDEVATDEVTGVTPTLSGTSQVQFIKLVDGAINSVNKSFIGTNNALATMQAVDGLSSAGTLVAPLRAFQNVAASTVDASIVASVSSKKIRVVAALFVTGATSTTLTFNSKGAGAGTAISVQFQNGSNGGAILAYNPLGWWETNTTEALTVTTGAGSTTGVQVVYVTI